MGVAADGAAGDPGRVQAEIEIRIGGGVARGAGERELPDPGARRG